MAVDKKKSDFLFLKNVFEPGSQEISANWNPGSFGIGEKPGWGRQRRFIHSVYRGPAMCSTPINRIGN